MGGIFDHRIVARKTIPGATFQVADYHWSAGADILDHHPEVLLRWRVRPYRIKAQGWIRPGEQMKFGQLMLQPAGIPTYATGAEEEEESRNVECMFEKDWLERVTEGRFESINELRPYFDLRHEGVDHAVRRLMRELLEPGFASNVLVESLGISIAVDIARIFNNVHEEDESKGALSAARLRRIQEFVDSFDEGCPTLSDIAKQCGISPAHLRRVYKATTGQTVHNYIEEVRVNRARRLLLESPLPLKVISYKLGFCHPSAFSFAFKKMTGEAPRDFRDRYANGQAVAA
jgi:AraC family transcriptional regulator